MKINKINIKIFLIVAFLYVFTGKSKAQLDPLYTQYMFNTLAVNPAYAGSHKFLSLNYINRRRWVGFDGAPKTNTINGHALVNKKMGVGGNLFLHKQGPVEQFSVSGCYAYQLKLNEKNILSLGLQGGFDKYLFNMADLSYITSIDEAYNNVPEDETLFNFGFGVYIFAKNYYFGVSIPRIIENEYKTNDVVNSEKKQVRHYYIMYGRLFKIDTNFALKPSTFVRITRAHRPVLDLNLAAIIHKRFSIGFLYRTNSTLGGILQYQINNKIKVAYSYDMSLKELRKYNDGAHEILLSYDFNFQKKKIFNPRFF